MRIFIAAVAAVACVWTGTAQGPGKPAEKRINALVVSGGCCHDYALQGKLLVDAISKALPVD